MSIHDIQRLLNQNLGSRYQASVTPGTLRLELSIPWCRRTLRWQVLLSNPPNLTSPDFIFDDYTYQPLCGSLPPPQLTALQHALLAWPLKPNPSSSSSSSTPSPSAVAAPSAAMMADALASLVGTLLSGFRDHQLSRLSSLSHEHLDFELSTLPSTAPPTASAKGPHGSNTGVEAGSAATAGGEAATGLYHTALEVLHMDAKDGEPAKACFGIPLQGLDASKLGHLQPGLEPTSFKLQVAFKLTALKTDPVLCLELPPDLTGPGGLPEVLLPSWTPHSCLMEYVPQVVERVGQAVTSHCDALALRQALLDALSLALGGNRPLEVCVSDGSGLWSLAWEGQPVLLSVSCLPSSPSPSAPRFPEEQPLLTLTNIRALRTTPDAVRTYRAYPWSPRWPAAEMAARITGFLAQELPTFLGLKPAAPPIALPQGAGSPTGVAATGAAVH